MNVSYDDGETWTKLNNLPVGQFTTLAVDSADPYNILGGLQDNGVMRGPSTYKFGKSDPEAWKSIYGGDGSCVVVDPKDPNVVYAALQFGIAARLNLKTGERAPIRPRPELSATKKEKPLRYNWVTPFILSPHSRDILYYGTNKLYRSFDRGDTWAPISGDLTSDREQGDVPFGTITSIAESPKTFGVIWAGTDEGKVWGTRDGGATWTDLSKGLAKDRWVTRVMASNFNEGTVYVSQNGYRNDEFAPYVFRSTDYGKTWQSLAAGLPNEPVNTVREDPKASHLLYVGTDSGVFVSLDRGETWTAMTGGLPNVPVHDLLVHPREGDLVVATHGRSVYVADAAPLRELKEPVRVMPLHAFKVKAVKTARRRGYGDHPWITWRRDDPVVRIAYWSIGNEPVKLTVKDENGSVWKTIEGTRNAGMNVVEYDLSADPKLADAAEKVARDKALAKEKKKDEEKDKDAEKDRGEGQRTRRRTQKPAAAPPRSARPTRTQTRTTPPPTSPRRNPRPPRPRNRSTRTSTTSSRIPCAPSASGSCRPASTPSRSSRASPSRRRPSSSRRSPNARASAETRRRRTGSSGYRRPMVIARTCPQRQARENGSPALDPTSSRFTVAHFSQVHSTGRIWEPKKLYQNWRQLSRLGQLSYRIVFPASFLRACRMVATSLAE